MVLSTDGIFVKGREVIIMNENENTNSTEASGAPQPNPQPTPIPTPQPDYVYTQSQRTTPDVGAQVQGMANGLIGVFKAPFNNIPAYVEKSGWLPAVIVTAAYALIRIIFGLLNLAIYGAGNYYNDSVARIILNYVLRFFAELFIAAATVAIIAGLVMLTVQLIGKSKISFFNSLSLASLYAVVMIPTVILKFLFGLASSSFANVFVMAGGALGLMFVAIGLSALLKTNDAKNKLPYVIAVIIAAVQLANWLLYIIF